MIRRAIARQTDLNVRSVTLNEEVTDDTGEVEVESWSEAEKNHKLFCHANKKVVKSFGYTGQNCNDCKDCMASNIESHKAYRGSRQKYQVEVPFHFVHADLCVVTEGKRSGGKLSPYGSTSTNMLVLVDDFTDFKYVAFPDRKNKVGDLLSIYVKYVKNFFEQNIKMFGTDKGLEFVGGGTLKLVHDEGIRLTTTSGYSSKSNGKVESTNKTIMRRVRSMLSSSKLSLDFWEEAAIHVVEMLNREQKETLKGKSPLLYLLETVNAENQYVELPDAEFGALCYVKLAPTKLGKLDPRGTAGVYLGISDTVLGGHMVWVPADLGKIRSSQYFKSFGKVIHTKDVLVQDELFMLWYKGQYGDVKTTSYEDFNYEETSLVEKMNQDAVVDSLNDFLDITKNEHILEGKNEDADAAKSDPINSNIVIHNHIHTPNTEKAERQNISYTIVPDVNTKSSNVLPENLHQFYNIARKDYDFSNLGGDGGNKFGGGTSSGGADNPNLGGAKSGGENGYYPNLQNVLEKDLDEISIMNSTYVESTRLEEYIERNKAQLADIISKNDIKYDELEAKLKLLKSSNGSEEKINEIEARLKQSESIKDVIDDLTKRQSSLEKDAEEKTLEFDKSKEVITEEASKLIVERTGKMREELENSYRNELSTTMKELSLRNENEWRDSMNAFDNAVESKIRTLQENEKQIVEKVKEQELKIDASYQAYEQKVVDLMSRIEEKMNEKLDSKFIDAIKNDEEGLRTLDSKLETVSKMLRSEMVKGHEELSGGTVEYLKGLENNIQALRGAQNYIQYHVGERNRALEQECIKINDDLENLYDYVENENLGITNNLFVNVEYVPKQDMNGNGDVQKHDLNSQNPQIEELEFEDRKMITAGETTDDHKSNGSELVPYQVEAKSNSDMIVYERKDSLLPRKRVRQNNDDVKAHDSSEEDVLNKNKEGIGFNQESVSNRLRSGRDIRSTYRRGAQEYSKYRSKRIKLVDEYKVKTKDTICVPNIKLKEDEVQDYIQYVRNVSLKSALSSVEKEHWIHSMEKEYNNLLSHNTWNQEAKELTTAEEKRRVVRTMWVLNVKRDGTYKARLVARGDNQPGDTYGDISSYTLSYESLRIILAEAASMGFEIEFMDISNAYVNADIDTEIYIQLPENTPFLKVKNRNGHKVYGHRLIKSLYGLKQSGRNWQQLLQKELFAFGFEKWNDIDCIVRKRDEHGATVCIVGYFVDDLIIAGTPKFVKETIQNIQRVFKCTIADFNAEGGKEILGVDIRFEGGYIKLNQEKFIRKIGERFNVEYKKYVTPLTPGFYFKPENRDLDINVIELNERIAWMRSAVGSLLFIAGATRPDIQYAVNYIARFVLVPSDEIIAETNRILRYVVSTGNYEIRYKIGDQDTFDGYSDADHSGDKSDYISVRGSLFMYTGGPIAWRSKKGRVCQSSTEAELHAFIQTCNMSRRLRRILKFIYGFDDDRIELKQNLIYCDNTSTLKMVSEGTVTQQTGYLGQDAAVAYQYVEDKEIVPEKIDTKENVADVMTKPINGETMRDMIKLLYGI